MKLASLKSSAHRDGELCIVNKELTIATKVDHIAQTLQQALDQWDKLAERLNEIYVALNKGEVKHCFAFAAKEMAAPLPRAYQWVDGSAYVNHVELLRKARGAEMPVDFWTIPLVYQGGSDTFQGPCDPIEVADETYGVDFEAEVAIITDDVPMGINSKQAAQHIKLLMLVNDISLRNLVPAEVARGFGFFQSKPSCSCSPVAITPDELGEHWDGQRVHLPLLSYFNDALFGQPNTGIDMTFTFPDLIAHVAKTRRLTAGTIIGSGTVSNVDRSKGSSCIAEKRMLEILSEGKPRTEFMRFGDSVRIEMLNPQGQSYFGAIEQTLTHYKGSS